MKKIMYTRANDGGVSIITPSPKSEIENMLGSMSDEQYEAIIMRSVPSDAIGATEIDDDVIPVSEEMFYKAWKQNGNKIDIDLEIARAIQLERIRAAREPWFKELDQEFMQAIEKGLDTKEIAEDKQYLRDITEPLKALELTSIDDVKSAFPKELKNKE